MTKITDPRLLAFIANIKRSQSQGVLDEFMKEVEQCKDHENANLGLMLANAKRKNPKAAEHKKVERSMFRSILRHCNS